MGEYDNLLMFVTLKKKIKMLDIKCVIFVVLLMWRRVIRIFVFVCWERGGVRFVFCVVFVRCRCFFLGLWVRVFLFERGV